MRALLALLLITGVAHGGDEPQRFALVGLGTAMSNETAGWAFRVANRVDAKHAGDDEAHPVIGGIVGLDVWSAGAHWGLSFPLGAYVGAQVGSVRTTLGGGFGIYAVEKRDNEQGGASGIAPFASATVEKIAGDLIIVFEGTLAREIIVDRADHNVYSVMLMAGRRFGR